MNIILGSILIGASTALFLKQRPSIKSFTTKTYGASCGFGIFSLFFPMAHWSFVLIGILLQLLVLCMLIVVAHDYRVNTAMNRHEQECKELGKALKNDFEHDREIGNSFYKKGYRAAMSKKIR